jgi:hypothetical protein
MIYDEGIRLNNEITEFSFPIFVEMEPARSAVSMHYQFDGEILSISGSASPAKFVSKYRFQNNCWRLIGFDHFSKKLEIFDGRLSRSENHLTGSVIEEYEAEIKEFKNDPEVICLR